MYRFNQIFVKQIMPLFMAVLLLLPVWISMMHNEEDHQHTSCNSITTHLHADEADCNLCDFSLIAFDLIPEYSSESIFVALPLERILDANSEVEISQLDLHYLRGPPLV